MGSRFPKKGLRFTGPLKGYGGYIGIYRVQGLGFRICGLGLRFQDLGFQEFGSGVYGVGFRICGFEFAHKIPQRGVIGGTI